MPNLPTVHPVPITPEQMIELAEERKAQAIEDGIALVNRILERDLPDFYWKGFVDVRSPGFHAGWQAFHKEVISLFAETWKDQYRIERMGDVEVREVPGGMLYMSPVYRFHLNLMRKDGPNG